MDQVKMSTKQYAQILADYVNKMAEERNAALGNSLEYQAIVDLSGGHFQLLSMGWAGHKFLYQILMHFDLKPNGKIWVQQNNTEILVDRDLGELGIPKTDIVPGFKPKEMRELGGFAAA